MKMIGKIVAIVVLTLVGFMPSVSARTTGVLYGDALVIGYPGTTVAAISSAGALTVTGLTNTGAISQTGALALTGAFSHIGSFADTPDATTYAALAGTTTLVPTVQSFVVINGTGTLSMTSTPHIATTTAVSGQSLTIMGGTNVVTFTDEGTLTGSLLELGAATRALGAGDILKLRYYSGKWYEEAFVNN